MMIKRILKTVLVLLIGITAARTAQAQVGITAVPFLQIVPDSRSAGMGNSGVAIADNATAIFWNPAGLAFQEGSQISITHSNWLPNFNTDLFYDYLVGKYEVEGIGEIGGHLTYLNLGEQVRTDESGRQIGNFSSYELAGGLSHGFQLNKNLSVGTGFRFIYSKLVPNITVGGQQAHAGTSIGVDVATMYRSDQLSILNRNARFKAGLNITNIGPGIQYTDNAQKDPLPTLLRAGWSYKMDLDTDGYNSLTLTMDISKIMARSDSTHTTPPLKALVTSWGPYERFNGQETVTLTLLEQLMIGTGFEYWYNDLFALRGGFYHEDEENGGREFLTFGAGLRYKMFGVDFSYIHTLKEDHPMAGTTRFSVLFNF